MVKSEGLLFYFNVNVTVMGISNLWEHSGMLVCIFNKPHRATFSLFGKKENTNIF